MNNVFFLEAAMEGQRPQRIWWRDIMGFKPGDGKILLAPLDWVGFHIYSRRIVSDARKEKHLAAEVSVAQKSRATPRVSWTTDDFATLGRDKYDPNARILWSIEKRVAATIAEPVGYSQSVSVNDFNKSGRIALRKRYPCFPNR